MNIFLCEFCHYSTLKKQNYEKHLLSKKHILNSTTENQTEEQNNKDYICQTCEKRCKTRSTLWSHKKVCISENNNTEVKIEEIKHLLINQEKEMENQKIQMETLKNLIIELTKKDFVAAAAAVAAPTTINNNFKNNNNFNINVFLNQDCKNAINFMDFINGIKLEIEDLLLLEKTEYVDGISQIIKKNMNTHSLYERPIHYQLEKEKIHIKDENRWKNKKDEVKCIFNNGIFNLDYNLVKKINDNRMVPRFSDPLEIAIKNIRKKSMFHTENDINGKKIMEQILNDIILK
jgi:hypothetical protein